MKTNNPKIKDAQHDICLKDNHSNEHIQWCKNFINRTIRRKSRQELRDIPSGCVCCGSPDPLPEGRLICPNCEAMYKEAE